MCADIVEYASLGATTEIGDVISTETPEDVSTLSDGDTSTPRSRVLDR